MEGMLASTIRATALATLGACAALCSGCSSSTNDAPAARACTISPTPASDWRLHADGVRLKDASGRVVFLRGVNAGGRSKWAPYVPFDYAADGYDAALASYMDRAASWGIDVMRVPFTWAALETTPGDDDEDWLTRYGKLLDAAWARGIWTFVDFHQDVYSELYCGDGFPVWTIPGATPVPHQDCPDWPSEYASDPDVQAAFDRFWADGSTVQAQYVAAWDRMIARFADRPGVIGFEPINEPWLTIDTAEPEATTLSAFYDRMVVHMRAAAPNSLVLVDPAGIDGETVVTTLRKPAGDGVVFAPHFYPIAEQTEDTTPTILQHWVDVGTSWNAPVLVGEFGKRHDDDVGPQILGYDYEAFDALGLSATQWEYSVAAQDWNDEAMSVVAPDGTEYPVVDALARPFARAIAGDGVVQQYDPTTRTFTLDYAPTSGGVSEIQLPTRVYSSGVAVQLTGGCYDATSQPGRLLVQADDGASTVSLTVAPR